MINPSQIDAQASQYLRQLRSDAYVHRAVLQEDHHTRGLIALLSRTSRVLADRAIAGAKAAKAAG